MVFGAVSSSGGEARQIGQLASYNTRWVYFAYRRVAEASHRENRGHITGKRETSRMLSLFFLFINIIIMTCRMVELIRERSAGLYTWKRYTHLPKSSALLLLGLGLLLLVRTTAPVCVGQQHSSLSLHVQTSQLIIHLPNPPKSFEPKDSSRNTKRVRALFHR